MPSHRLFVPADRPLTRAPVVVPLGHFVMVTHIRGTVFFNTSRAPSSEVGPEGLARPDFVRRWPDDAKTADPLTGEHQGHAGLMAVLGGRPRFVGAKATLKARLGGELSLGVNDATIGGGGVLANSGGFWVEIISGRPEDRTLRELLGHWRRTQGGGPALLAFDLDRTWRRMERWSRRKADGGEVVEIGTEKERPFIRLRSERRREEVWSVDVTADRLTLVSPANVIERFERM